MVEDPLSLLPASPLERPLNPFESAFDLIKVLRDELQELKVVVSDISARHAERLDSVDSSLSGFRASIGLRFNHLQDQLDKVSSERIGRFEALQKLVEEMRQEMRQHKGRSKVDEVEEMLKREVTERLAADVSLDKKLLAKMRELQALCDKNRSEHQAHVEKVEIVHKGAHQKHDGLRLDVEKLAALLSYNTLSRDPYNELGYQRTSPQSQIIADIGGTTLRALPPLYGDRLGTCEIQGSDNASRPGTNAGSRPGANVGSRPGTNEGSRPGSRPGTNTGQCPGST